MLCQIRYQKTELEDTTATFIAKSEAAITIKSECTIGNRTWKPAITEILKLESASG